MLKFRTIHGWENFRDVTNGIDFSDEKLNNSPFAELIALINPKNAIRLIKYFLRTIFDVITLKNTILNDFNFNPEIHINFLIFFLFANFILSLNHILSQVLCENFLSNKNLLSFTLLIVISRQLTVRFTIQISS